MSVTNFIDEIKIKTLRFLCFLGGFEIHHSNQLVNYRCQKKPLQIPGCLPTIAR